MAALHTKPLEGPTASYMPMADEGDLQATSGPTVGDGLELQVIWEEFGHHILWRRCLSWMGEHYEDAEDAMHTAAVRVCKYLGQGRRTVENPQAWLHRLLYNQCMTLQRGNQRRQSYLQMVAEMETIAHASSTYRQESAEDAVLQSELETYIQTLVEALPDRLKEPLKLCFFQGMSQRDIALYLNLSHENVRKRLQQGRDVLRDQLKQYLEGDRCIN